MPGKGGLRELLAAAEQHPARWAVVAAGVLVLLWLKLVLFAAALPLMAYWHYSNQTEDIGDADPDACDGADDENADLDPPWPPEDEEEDGDDDGAFPADDDRDAPLNIGKEDHDPYDKSFWSAEETQGAPKRSAPWRSIPRAAPPKGSAAFGGGPRGLDDPLGLGLDGVGAGPLAAADPRPMPKQSSAPWDADGPDAEPLDLGLGGLSGKAGGSTRRGLGGELRGPGAAQGGEPDLLDSLGLDVGGLHGPSIDHDFGLGLLGDDMDLFGGGPAGGGRGKGRGKGKAKGGDKGPRDPMAPREPNPKQVFVANVGDMPEDDIRAFFEDVGEVDRLKVLRTPEGASKGVCFVTFRTEEQAQKALTLHGTMLEGKNLVVRLAHGGNKGGEKGDKGGKGGGGPGGPDRFGHSDRFGGDRFGGDRCGGDRFGGDRFGGDRFGGDRFGGDRFGGDRTAHEGLPDLGGSERFGPAFGDSERDRGDRGDRGGFGKGGGRGGKGPGGGRRTERGEMDDLLEEALAEGDGPVKPADFDFAARRFLSELRSRDRTDGTNRFQEAIDMVLKYTSSKDRSSVRKWPAYIFTLLQKFDPHLWEELRERDAERRREKGGGGFGAARERKPSD